MGKLIEKVIRERLQFQVVSNNFIHQSQLEGLKFKSTINVGIALTHFICIGQIRNMSTSTLVFDIAQFFPSLNHCLLSLILGKARFESRVINFFSNYLVNRKTNYSWNNFSSHLFDVNVGVGQGLAHSSILPVLYFSLFLHILEKHLKNLDLKISTLSFVDDSLFITQSKSFQVSNTQLFSSYNVASKLLSKFGLLVKHSKIEVFHFSRSYGTFNLPPLDLLSIGGPSLIPKDTQRYLGFISDRKFCFCQHINFYANKAIFTVYEDTWQFDKRFESPAKTPFVQKLCSPYSSVQISVIILFQSFYIVFSKTTRKPSNTSSYIDIKSFQNSAIIWIRSNCRFYPNPPIPSKTQWKIPTQSAHSSC